MWDGKASARIVETLTRQFTLHADVEQTPRVDHGDTLPKESVCPLQ